VENRARQAWGKFLGAAPKLGEQHAYVSPLRIPDRKALSVVSFPEKPGPRRFVRVPTHAVGVASDRRGDPRANLSLPLRLLSVGQTPEPFPLTLVTRNISSSGIYFLAPREIEIGASLELEVALVERPMGCGSVQMITAAHIVRAEDCGTLGWRGYAATFDDFALRRDDNLPLRF